MTADHPKVTVYLPTRNRASLLRDAIDSVLVQTEADFELIVVDDASTDETMSICEHFAKADARVRIARLPVSRGAPAARNLAIGMARGEFITGLDDDDLVLPGRLASLLSAFDHGVAFVCSSFWLEKNRYGKRRRTLLNSRARTITCDDLLYQNCVGNQLLTRTRQLQEIGGFDESLVASQDYDLWTRLAARFGPGRRIADPTYVMRSGMTAESISSSNNFGLGARQYTSKHESRMNSAQRRSQRLLHRITARESLRVHDVAECFAWPTLGLMIRYALSRHRLIVRLRELLRT